MKSFGITEHTGYHGLAHLDYTRMAETIIAASFFAKVLVDKGKVA